MISMQEFPAGGGGPRGPPPIDYAIEAYLPLVLATTVFPLLGLSYLAVRAALAARRGRPLTRPESPVYSVYVIAGLLPLLGGNAVFMKAVLDNVYGTIAKWLYIRDYWDLHVYKAIGEFLAAFHLAAGAVLGLSLILVLYRGSYDNWYADLLVYAGNAAWFLVLARIPLRDFKYTLTYIRGHEVPPGAQPFDLIEPLFTRNLAIGLALGAAVSLAVYSYYRRRRRQLALAHGKPTGG